MRFLTYEEQLDLVKQGLAVVSVNNNLSTFKYAKKVMYDYLWNKHPELRACRGHTYNNRTGEIVTCPPMKSFNYLENDWWKDVALSTKVVAHKKYNGFMACAGHLNDETIVSTTGSTKSEYAAWAKEVVTNDFDVPHNTSMLYEIIVPQDPHIVAEPHYGAVPLGHTTLDGLWTPFTTSELDFSGTLQEVIKFTETDKGEGFMVYLADEDGNQMDTHNPCKMKTPYYVGKKKLMRARKNTCNLMYNQTRQFLKGLSPMWEEVVYNIKFNYKEQEWLDMPEQHRRKVIELMIG